MKPSSRARLSPFTTAAFDGDTLFDAVGRVVSAAACLPRKELFEAWHVAKRVHKRLRPGGPVVEVAAGHGLVSWLLLLLGGSGWSRALLVDARVPESAGRLEAALVARWPALSGRVTWHPGEVEDAPVGPDAVVVAVHACGGLTDRAIALARRAPCRLAVLPCCQRLGKDDAGGLEAWLDGQVAVDAVRALRLRDAGWRTHATTIPAEVTPQNRLLVAEPPGWA